jgi:hypothetical protein
MGVDLGLILFNPLAAFKCSYQHPGRDKLIMDEITLLRNKDFGSKTRNLSNDTVDPVVYDLEAFDF